MKISEVSAMLQKVQQLAGDVPVVLKDLETGNVTGLVSVGIELVADAAEAVNEVTISHAKPASPPPAPGEAATTTAGQ